MARRVRWGVSGLGWSLVVALALSGCQAFDPALLKPRSRSGFDAGSRNSTRIDAGTSDAGDARVGTQPSDASSSTPEMDAGRRDASQPAPDAARDSGAQPAVDSGGGDAGSVACDSVAVDDYCAQLPSLPAAPVIDGVLDCGPELKLLAGVGWNGTDAMPSAIAAKIAAAARPDGLYVYVEVHGQPPVPHPSGAIECGDAVEFYVDADGVEDSAGRYSMPGTVQVIVAAPSASNPGTLEAMRFVQGMTQGAWSGGRVATALLDDGYVVEGFIDADDLGLASWMPVHNIGFDVAIDVSGPAGSANLRCGVQLGQFFMRVNAPGDAACKGEPWCDTRAFCNPTL